MICLLNISSYDRLRISQDDSTNDKLLGCLKTLDCLERRAVRSAFMIIRKRAVVGGPIIPFIQTLITDKLV